jgi:hypothetical protein
MNAAPGRPRAPRRAAGLAAAMGAGSGARDRLTRAAQPPPGLCSQTAVPAAATVVWLSASRWACCRKPRSFFAREGIGYCEYAIESSATGPRRIAALGARGIPVILVRDEAVFGYVPEVVRLALELDVPALRALTVAMRPPQRDCRSASRGRYLSMMHGLAREQREVDTFAHDQIVAIEELRFQEPHDQRQHNQRQHHIDQHDRDKQ